MRNAVTLLAFVVSERLLQTPPSNVITVGSAKAPPTSMKTIGMLGGMSWESSTVYYQLINREVQRRLGGVHSAKALMYSFDFGEIEAALQSAGRWVTRRALVSRMSGGARRLAARIS